MRSIKIIATFFKIISVILILLVITFLLIPNLLGLTLHIDYLGTMSPNIKKGSISYINKNIKYERIKKDDIIGITIRNQQITSRVLKVNEDKMLETKGDREPKEEMIIVTKEEYVGRVVLTIPYVGTILIFIHKHFILTTILILIIIVVLTLDFVSDKKKNCTENTKNEEEKKEEPTTDKQKEEEKKPNDKIKNKDTDKYKNKNKEKITSTNKKKDNQKTNKKNNEQDDIEEFELSDTEKETEKNIEKEINKENEIKGIYEDIDII